ncbi:hypothetical protein B0T26DRAFT_140897 [Lasiosphaeria miniovina]|uniref:Uncharacterized protein n=1 Tax=Lasiosphaeria miniovina TaxID=1954250 RepID=A0AA40E876_9PEZI|nr:uncharacterized protein B0T26DRAFT_140897 [Lasiosphaeria miniovina]KAK0727611.1 hypothetical protein B0T26DRAFT_140897 [Lasiosphaeria miniovina]
MAAYLGALASQIDTLSRTGRPDSGGMSTAALEVVEIIGFAKMSFKKGRGENAVEIEHSPVDALQGKVLVHRFVVGAFREVRFKTPKKDSISVEILHFTTQRWAKGCFFYRVLKAAHPSEWEKSAENLGQFALMKDRRVIVWCHSAVVIEISLLRPPASDVVFQEMLVFARIIDGKIRESIKDIDAASTLTYILPQVELGLPRAGGTHPRLLKCVIGVPQEITILHIWRGISFTVVELDTSGNVTGITSDVSRHVRWAIVGQNLRIEPHTRGTGKLRIITVEPHSLLSRSLEYGFEIAAT